SPSATAHRQPQRTRPTQPEDRAVATFHIWTLGCQMNQADSLKLAAGLERLGYRPGGDDAAADMVVINTCSVRQHAEDRAYSRLGVLRKRREQGQRVSIAVMGCMVGPKTDDLRRRFPYVDAWARPQQFDPILELASESRDTSEGELGGLMAGGMRRTYGLPSGPTAFVPVVHGCDKVCPHCIVPRRRRRREAR